MTPVAGSQETDMHSSPTVMDKVGHKLQTTSSDTNAAIIRHKLAAIIRHKLAAIIRHKLAAIIRHKLAAIIRHKLAAFI